MALSRVCFISPLVFVFHVLSELKSKQKSLQRVCLKTKAAPANNYGGKDYYMHCGAPRPLLGALTPERNRSHCVIYVIRYLLFKLLIEIAA